MSRRAVGILMVVAALLLVAATAFVNFEALSEAYGAGPPYYSRTTNMDRWRDPLPELVVAELVVAVVAGVLLRAGLGRIG